MSQSFTGFSVRTTRGAAATTEKARAAAKGEGTELA